MSDRMTKVLRYKRRYIESFSYYDTCENTILKYIRDRSIIRGYLSDIL